MRLSNKSQEEVVHSNTNTRGWQSAWLDRRASHNFFNSLPTKRAARSRHHPNSVWQLRLQPQVID